MLFGKPFESYTLVAFDTETSNGRGGGSLNERDGFIALMQMRIGDGEVEIIDPLAPDFNTEHAPRIRKILADPDNLIVGHNVKFDYKWLAYNGFYIRNIFDTMIASQLYYTGYSFPDDASNTTNKNKQVWKGREDFIPIFSDFADMIDLSVVKTSRFSHAYDACMLRELGIDISKLEQRSDWARRPLTPEQIEYAKGDVEEIGKLAKRLYAKLRGEGLDAVFELEMRTQHMLAFMEVTGLMVDKPAWSAYAQRLSQEVVHDKKQLEAEFGARLAKQRGDRQGLFGVVNVPVNLNSSKAMASYLGLPNLKASTLRDAADSDLFIPKLIDYKEKQKLASTYGESYLERIGDDSRIRSDFKQTMTATGRLSSASPNLQNIKPNQIKSLIRPAPGHSVVSVDYSTVELRILAYASGDEAFIEACNSLDMHSANARMLFHIPEDEPVPKALRRKAKVVSFGVPYGSSAFGLFARGLFDTEEEAAEMIERFNQTYPKAFEYLQKNAKNAMYNGQTRDAYGRIRRYHVPDKPADFNVKKNNLTIFRRSLEGTDCAYQMAFAFETYDELILSYPYLKSRVDENVFRDAKTMFMYERKLSSIRREGQNMPIQGTSASTTKQALADLYEYLRDTGYGLVTLTIHDSIFFELLDKYFPYSYPDVLRLMRDAGPKILPGIITPVDADLGWLDTRRCKTHNQDTFVYNQVLTDDGYPRYLTDEELRAASQAYCEKEHG